jgi:hypothetical protein
MYHNNELKLYIKTIEEFKIIKIIFSFNKKKNEMDTNKFHDTITVLSTRKKSKQNIQINI